MFIHFLSGLQLLSDVIFFFQFSTHRHDRQHLSEPYQTWEGTETTRAVAIGRFMAGHSYIFLSKNTYKRARVVLRSLYTTDS